MCKHRQNWVLNRDLRQSLTYEKLINVWSSSNLVYEFDKKIPRILGKFNILVSNRSFKDTYLDLKKILRQVWVACSLFLETKFEAKIKVAGDWQKGGINSAKETKTLKLKIFKKVGIPSPQEK